MTDFVIIVVLILGAAVFAFFLILGTRRDKKRQEDVQNLAEEMGLAFQPTAEENFQERVALFKLFKKGHSQQILNIVVGEVPDLEIVIFDYHYSVGRGKQQQHHRHTVALIESRELAIPAFTLRPESVFDKLGAIIGMQDIDFDSHPLFSKMFLLKGDDEAEIREFFDDSILNLMQGKPKVCVEATHGKMIVYYGSKPPKADQLKSLFAEALEVHSVFAERAQILPGRPNQEFDHENN